MDRDGPAEADNRALRASLSKALRAELGEASMRWESESSWRRLASARPPVRKEGLKGLGHLIGCARPSGHDAGARSARGTGKYPDD
jgi:hypothetical protein